MSGQGNSKEVKYQNNGTLKEGVIPEKFTSRMFIFSVEPVTKQPEITVTDPEKIKSFKDDDLYKDDEGQKIDTFQQNNIPTYGKWFLDPKEERAHLVRVWSNVEKLTEYYKKRIKGLSDIHQQQRKEFGQGDLTELCASQKAEKKAMQAEYFIIQKKLQEALAEIPDTKPDFIPPRPAASAMGFASDMDADIEKKHDELLDKQEQEKSDLSKKYEQLLAKKNSDLQLSQTHSTLKNQVIPIIAEIKKIELEHATAVKLLNKEHIRERQTFAEQMRSNQTTHNHSSTREILSELRSTEQKQQQQASTTLSTATTTQVSEDKTLPEQKTKQNNCPKSAARTMRTERNDELSEQLHGLSFLKDRGFAIELQISNMNVEYKKQYRKLQTQGLEPKVFEQKAAELTQFYQTKIDALAAEYENAIADSSARQQRQAIVRSFAQARYEEQQQHEQSLASNQTNTNKP